VYVFPDGNIGIHGNNILKGNIADGYCAGGVRPVLWLSVFTQDGAPGKNTTYDGIHSISFGSLGRPFGRYKSWNHLVKSKSLPCPS
jgi:hypothetical protein